MAVSGARPATWLDGLSGRLLPPARVRRLARETSPRIRAGARRPAKPVSLSLVLGAILLAAGLGLFQISLSSDVAAAGYAITRLEARLADLEAQYQELQFRIGQAEAPSRIADRAATLRLTPIDPSRKRFASPLADRHP